MKAVFVALTMAMGIGNTVFAGWLLTKIAWWFARYPLSLRMAVGVCLVSSVVGIGRAVSTGAAGEKKDGATLIAEAVGEQVAVAIGLTLLLGSAALLSAVLS